MSPFTHCKACGRALRSWDTTDGLCSAATVPGDTPPRCYEFATDWARARPEYAKFAGSMSQYPVEWQVVIDVWLTAVARDIEELDTQERYDAWEERQRTE